MDGTGHMFGSFITALGKEFDITIFSYPATEAFGYDELESIVRE